ncbi:hypothetical protein ACLMJK_002501 [Lecanora helva]
MILISFTIFYFLTIINALSIPSSDPSIFQLQPLDASTSSATTLNSTTTTNATTPDLSTDPWPPLPFTYRIPTTPNLSLTFLYYGRPFPPSQSHQIPPALDGLILHILRSPKQYYNEHTSIALNGRVLVVKILFLRRVTSVRLAIVMQALRGLLNAEGGFGPREIGECEFGEAAPWVVLGRLSVRFGKG